MKWRNALLITTVIIAALYVLVVFVALVVSGTELLRQPLAYYAALMPFVYFAVCLLTATGHIPTHQLRVCGVVAHLLVAPCLVLSFLGIGLLFPVLAFLWYKVYQWRLSMQDDAA